MATSTKILRALGAFGTGALVGGGSVATVIRSGVADNEEPQPSSAPSNPTVLKYGAPAPLTAGVFCYSNHCLEFDPSRRTPIWVAEHIDRTKVEPADASRAANRKRSRFKPDMALAAEIRASNDDFWDSGWSRGHMAPAGNNKHCQKSMDDTFLLSNIVPQDVDNNGDFWNRLEIYCRDLTKKFDDVRVISGPLWLPGDRPSKLEEDSKLEDCQGEGDGQSGPKKSVSSRLKELRRKNKVVKHEVIGGTGVFVPTHLYKVILAEKSSGDSDKETGHFMAAFVVPNKHISKEKTLKDFWVPVSELERRIGYRFHSRLERSAIGDLCETEGCNMMGVRDMQRYIILKSIKYAKNDKDLDKYLQRAKEKDLFDIAISDAYDSRKTHLKSSAGATESVAQGA